MTPLQFLMLLQQPAALCSGQRLLFSDVDLLAFFALDHLWGPRGTLGRFGSDVSLIP